LIEAIEDLPESEVATLVEILLEERRILINDSKKIKQWQMPIQEMLGWEVKKPIKLKIDAYNDLTRVKRRDQSVPVIEAKRLSRLASNKSNLLLDETRSEVSRLLPSPYAENSDRWFLKAEEETPTTYPTVLNI